MAVENAGPERAGSLALVIGEILTALWGQKKMIVGTTLVCALKVSS